MINLDSNERILFELTPKNDGSAAYFVNVIAITEEIDIINEKTDHWIKIEDEQGRSGWIFGGYASVERGGAKYYTPEDIIYYALSWY